MKGSNKCPRCRHTYTSKTHKTRCLHQAWKKRRPRASTSSSGPDWGRVLAPFSAPMASQSFFSDRKFDGEVIQTSTPDASEVTA